MGLSIVSECPQFTKCACNDCPLDAGSELHTGKRGDEEPDGRAALPGEERCHALKATRERIAAAHGYEPDWAWTHDERVRHARRERARAAWAAMPEERRNRFVAAGQAHRNATQERAGIRFAPGARKSSGQDGAK